MGKFAVIFEQSGNGFGAYIPDLPGCVALGLTLDKTRQLIHEAMDQYLAAMRRDGDEIPAPSVVDTEFREAA